MGIKIIDKSKVNFIIGGSDNDTVKCDCYYYSNDIGSAGNVRNEEDCIRKCCEEGVYAYAYKFTSQVDKQQDASPKTCPRQMRNTQIEVVRWFGCAFAVGMLSSLLSILK